MGLLKEFICQEILKIKSKFNELSFMIHDQSRRADRCVYNIPQVLQRMQICAGPPGATVIASTGAVLITISHETPSFTFSLCSLQCSNESISQIVGLVHLCPAVM